ncbi:hypothetical protein A0H81_01252 [Grifola frondosa]|uniref:SMP-LTD domain-containing protein n=1 Tax=Grifola frondosa TaxID=5627 RepID=A0A1C7MUC1_GRIFR|nr:hypothetical protein A0H81_01252 [Grifola frondosa]
MSLRALLYAYVLGGLTFVPLVILGAIFFTIYTSVPVGDPVVDKPAKRRLEQRFTEEEDDAENADAPPTTAAVPPAEVNDLPRARKGWLTVRRTFEESPSDGSYVGMVRGFLDARSKDAKRSRPKDMWYVALKGKVLYLYEDEGMTECEAAIELSGHDVLVHPEGLLDGELFAKRNAICLRPRVPPPDREMPSVTKEMRFGDESGEETEEKGERERLKQRERERRAELEKQREEAREEAMDILTPWFIFVRSAVEMEDWYLALVHASDHPANSATLAPLQSVFRPEDMLHLVTTLDEQPDVIPMRWLNALLGRLFFSYYRTQKLESYIIGRLMKKISRIKRPGFLTDIVVREVSVGNRAPTFSKPMLKELTKEGDASLEVHLFYKGEVRITVEATATINLGARFKTYTVKLVLALVLREIEGNMLVKVKRPPSSRIWYAFTQMPRVVLDVEPVVSDRQITWSMILSTIESRVKEVLQESVVLPNMDDIAFFESAKYEHRGGIWADASRREKSTSLFPSTPPPSEDIRSQIHVTATITTSVAFRGGSRDEKPPRASGRRADDAFCHRHVLYTYADHIVCEAAHLVLEHARRRIRRIQRQQLTYTRNRRLSRRGRSSDTGDAVNRRSSSTPSNGGTSSSRETPQPEVTEENGHLSAPPGRRSSSQRSVSSRATSFSSAHDIDVSDTASEPQMATYRSKSPTNGSPRHIPTSPTSFLQTLKSRAGDKQALSNTARETMRKWGVNWGGLRRDGGGSPGSSNAVDDVPDGGHGEHRRAIDSKTQLQRPSYAEVRAAVQHRKEQERAAHLEAPPSGTNLHPSQPIPVPQGVKGKGRERSSRSAPVVPPVKSAPEITSVAPQPRSASPLPILRRTDSHISSSSREGASDSVNILPDEPEGPPSPIHTQPPPPKSMTIPGIHASHRGDVMSMGYAPPSPPPHPESKKAPAIQSVYRLWKNPNVLPAPSPSETPVSQTGFTGHDQDAASSSQAPPDVPPPRPVPPPLPPRTNSAHALQMRAEAARRAAEPDTSLSPASAALQSIASKDRTKRASLTPPSSPGQTGAAHESPPRLALTNPLLRPHRASRLRSRRGGCPAALPDTPLEGPIDVGEARLAPRKCTSIGGQRSAKRVWLGLDGLVRNGTCVAQTLPGDFALHCRYEPEPEPELSLSSVDRGGDERGAIYGYRDRYGDGDLA